MDSRSVQRSIRKAWNVVDQCGLGDYFSNPSSLAVNAAFRDVALADDVRYEDVYTKGLELLHYNFLLTDYSFFQFSWLGRDSVRYAFYPNPFSQAQSSVESLERLRELVEAEYLTHEEYLAVLADHHVANRYPLIRYERAPHEYRPLLHPCAHFHFGHPPRGRWCVAKALTPYAFTLLVLKHHYPDEWENSGSDDQDTGNAFERGLIAERANLDDIPNECMSVFEKRSFRFW